MGGGAQFLQFWIVGAKGRRGEQFTGAGADKEKKKNSEISLSQVKNRKEIKGSLEGEKAGFDR